MSAARALELVKLRTISPSGRQHKEGGGHLFDNGARCRGEALLATIMRGQSAVICCRSRATSRLPAEGKQKGHDGASAQGRRRSRSLHMISSTSAYRRRGEAKRSTRRQRESTRGPPLSDRSALSGPAATSRRARAYAERTAISRRERDRGKQQVRHVDARDRSSSRRRGEREQCRLHVTKYGSGAVHDAVQALGHAEHRRAVVRQLRARLDFRRRERRRRSRELRYNGRARRRGSRHQAPRIGALG